MVGPAAIATGASFSAALPKGDMDKETLAAVVAVALIGGITGMFAGGASRPAVDTGTVAWALGVGFSFGLLFVALDRAGDDSGQWPLLFARFTALPVLTLVLVPAALLIAMSRVVLGLHYPSDVVAGALLGALIGSLSMVFVGA